MVGTDCQVALDMEEEAGPATIRQATTALRLGRADKPSYLVQLAVTEEARPEARAGEAEEADLVMSVVKEAMEG
jgi:hypothetical protein